ncbi:hypothetical protein KJ765_01665 [Candidatus Micrarchaeota archaeon]|nr:hypothetical protein [Candidatus Micrarchaeota archaeon]
MADEYAKKLIIERLRNMPPNVSVSIGDNGTYSRNELIEQVRTGSEIGLETIHVELEFIRQLPRLAKRVQG